MLFPQIVFAYFSPETLLPVTSIVATVVGVVLMCGKNTFRFVMEGVRKVAFRPGRNAATKKPHFHLLKEKQTDSVRN